MQWTEAGGAVRDGGRHHDEVERGGHGPVAFSCRGCWRRHARRALPCVSTHGSEAMADTDEQRNGVGRRQAEDAVRTLLRWAGDDPAREGLLDTPKRVVDAYGDWFSGYADDPREYLERTLEAVGGYDEMIVMRDIELRPAERRIGKECVSTWRCRWSRKH